MNLSTFKEKINKNPQIKKTIHYLIMNQRYSCPRKWVKLVNFFVFKYGKNSKIRRSAIMNISPVNAFSIGDNSVIVYYSVVDNGVGPVNIGNNSLIGIRNTLIGPLEIGDNVILGQNIVISGLNHNYEDISLPIRKQGVNTSKIQIGDNSWIGSNSTIIAGVNIGKHVIIGAGSVVTKNIPDHSVAVGNPAKIIKKHDYISEKWVKVK